MHANESSSSVEPNTPTIADLENRCRRESGKWVSRFKSFRRYAAAIMLLRDSNRTTLQNTNRSRVTVHYRFHPSAGQELEVILYPVVRYEWIMVRNQRGHSLKFIKWMVY